MYVVWNDSESSVECYAEFWDLDEAAEFASNFVHQYDDPHGKRVIVHIEDSQCDDTIDTFENINYCNFI